MKNYTILAASLLAAGIAATSLRAEAAPDLSQVFAYFGHHAAAVPQVPKNVADPGAGRYTAILESSIADATGVKSATKPRPAEAQAADNPFIIDSAEYSERMHDKEMAKIDDDVITSSHPGLHASLPDSVHALRPTSG